MKQEEAEVAERISAIDELPLPVGEGGGEGTLGMVLLEFHISVVSVPSCPRDYSLGKRVFRLQYEASPVTRSLFLGNCSKVIRIPPPQF
jgi:hypothetical protein